MANEPGTMVMTAPMEQLIVCSKNDRREYEETLTRGVAPLAPSSPLYVNIYIDYLVTKVHQKLVVTGGEKRAVVLVVYDFSTILINTEAKGTPIRDICFKNNSHQDRAYRNS